MAIRLLAACLASLVVSPISLAQFVVADDLDRFGIDDFEITPDGLFAVGRENTAATTMLIYDLVNGGPPITHSAASPEIGGPVQDAVAVTADRAVVLGSRLLIADLSAAGAPLIVDHPVGRNARDLAITPDERLLIVRGGDTPGSNPEGQLVFDLATGAQLATHPGEPGEYFQDQYPFDVDSVVAGDHFAVLTSFIDNSPNGFATRVSVWDLTLQPPAVVFETGALTDLDGAPHDLALAPAGGFVAVRSEFEVSLFSLGGAAPVQSWTRALLNSPGPLGESVMDSIEVTDTRIATLSRLANGGVGAQIDVFDVAGNQFFQILPGDPHDLAITPSMNRLVARTSSQVLLFDIQNLPTTGNVLSALDFQDLASTHTSFGAGLDSVVVTDKQAVACARVLEDCEIRIYDISNDQLEEKHTSTMAARPIDVELAADGNTAWIAGFTYVLGLDLRTNRVMFEHDPAIGGGYPWCDGIAVSDGRVIAYGYTINPSPGTPIGLMSGWVSILDAFREPVAYCPASPNSTSAAAQLHATGSARVSANDLTLWATDVPAGAYGFFFYGDQQQQVPFGDGFNCVAGQVARFRAVRVGPDGVAEKMVDNTSSPAAGAAIVAGASLNFQFVYRDVIAGGTGLNLSNALTIDFTN